MKIKIYIDYFSFFHFYCIIITEQIEFNDKIKKLIDNEDNEVLDEGYYEWKIEDWNSIPTYQYSPVFDVANYKW